MIIAASITFATALEAFKMVKGGVRYRRREGGLDDEHDQVRPEQRGAGGCPGGTDVGNRGLFVGGTPATGSLQVDGGSFCAPACVSNWSGTASPTAF
ncbi:MAG TPA: hypothetical protein PKO45_12145 [Rubrivivax sp.]|nr:hypothetical protein [Rubrivivax sp.]